MIRWKRRKACSLPTRKKVHKMEVIGKGKGTVEKKVLTNGTGNIGKNHIRFGSFYGKQMALRYRITYPRVSSFYSKQPKITLSFCKELPKTASGTTRTFQAFEDGFVTALSAEEIGELLYIWELRADFDNAVSWYGFRDKRKTSASDAEYTYQLEISFIPTKKIMIGSNQINLRRKIFYIAFRVQVHKSKEKYEFLMNPFMSRLFIDILKRFYDFALNWFALPIQYALQARIHEPEPMRNVSQPSVQEGLIQQTPKTEVITTKTELKEKKATTADPYKRIVSHFKKDEDFRSEFLLDLKLFLLKMEPGKEFTFSQALTEYLKKSSFLEIENPETVYKHNELYTFLKENLLKMLDYLEELGYFESMQASYEKDNQTATYKGYHRTAPKYNIFL